MRYLVTVGADTLELEVERDPDGSYRVRAKDGPELKVTAHSNASGLLDLQVDGQSVQVLAAEGEVRYRKDRYAVRTESWLERAAAASGASNRAHSRKVVAAMPGRIVQILCEVGATISLGTPLIVMEAMKMQNELAAKNEGVVRAIPVLVGQTVERGELLVEFE
ncbi:MAG: biotin/lipoyl-containing protein [Polyangiaceae bacterium]